MAKKIYLCTFFIFLLFSSNASGLDVKDIRVPLRYNYLPGEPYWAKYGAIDNRNFKLIVKGINQTKLGSFVTNDLVQYDLWPSSDLTRYIADASSQILLHYGISIRSNGEYTILIKKAIVNIKGVEGEDNKTCSITMQIELYNPRNECLFSGNVTNYGIADLDEDEDLGYSDLIDRTLHGAILKIWGSQILFTDSPLGSGSIEKIDRGTFGFVPNSDSFSSTKTTAYFDSLMHDSTKFLSGHGIPEITNEDQTNLLIGTQSNDTVVAMKGHRVATGILPFENETGRDDLSIVLKAAQESFYNELTHASTIRILERDKLNVILREQALGLSGALDNSTVVKVGNLSGLQVMIATRLSSAGGYYLLNGRVINVETSAIVASANVFIADAMQISEAGSELAAKLLIEFTGEKIEINRNAMLYPPPMPRAIPALTASCEDAWSVEYNPASIMKIRQRDALFFTTFSEHVSGTTPYGEKVQTDQPVYADLGTNVALPLNSYIGTGFGIKHVYNYPSISSTSQGISYAYKEEETVITIPLALGISPKLSIGANLKTHITEYQTSQTDRSLIEGNSLSSDIMLGTLFKVSQRFRMGVTYVLPDVYNRAQEKTDNLSFVEINRFTAQQLRIGIAMYPLRWLFFFGDLEYKKFHDYPQLQPGFHLGLQLTNYGKLPKMSFMPKYGMLPLYLGYSHQPYDRATNTQQKYFSVGVGYYVNNLYIQWALRTNIGDKSERTIVLGSGSQTLKLSDYSYVAPFFVSVGYRF